MPKREILSFDARVSIARNLADAIAAGPWRVDTIVVRAQSALEKKASWLEPMAVRLVDRFGSGSRPTAHAIALWLDGDKGFRAACRRKGLAPCYARRPEAIMYPTPGPPSGWTPPSLVSITALAEFVEFNPGELEWFADVQGRGFRQYVGALAHYRYRWHAKRSGSARLIEIPKTRLMTAQRLVLDQILRRIPPHDAAHGFRTGRSVRTYVAPHVGRRVVLKLDLKDFFATITQARVVAVFRTVGYPEVVARSLAGLCVNRAPRAVWRAPGHPAFGPDSWRARRLYDAPHLPQGAPTSPALANLAAYRLDLRLSRLAEMAGACYTRYADDLAFSGDRDFESSIPRFQTRAFAIAIEEGFAIQPRKTRVMRQSVRQRVAGIVLNQHPNIARPEYDRLKAILHNCRTSGPASQNRESHRDFQAYLLGRVAHLASIHPERGRKLRALFDEISWSS